MNPFVVGSQGTILFCMYTTTERSTKGGQSGMRIENFAPILFIVKCCRKLPLSTKGWTTLEHSSKHGEGCCISYLEVSNKPGVSISLLYKLSFKREVAVLSNRWDVMRGGFTDVPSLQKWAYGSSGYLKIRK